MFGDSVVQIVMFWPCRVHVFLFEQPMNDNEVNVLSSKCIDEKAAPVNYWPVRPWPFTGSCSGLYVRDLRARHMFIECMNGSIGE